jgi:arabinofuranan 3-O-arabinosyltransferase
VKRAALVCALLALAGAVFALKASRKMPDFEVYWRAAGRVIQAEPLYNPDDGHYQYKYLPAFAILAVPLAWFPLHVAKAIWFALSAALIGAFVALSIGLLPDRRKRYWVLVTCVVVAMAKFFGHELVLGQVNLLLGVLLTAAVGVLRHRREGVAGLLVGLAVIVKPYAVIFLPWLAAAGRRRALATGLATVAAAVALPIAVYGVSQSWSLHVDWWRTVSTSTAPNLLNADNVSIAAMYTKWIGAGAMTAWLTFATAGGLAALIADTIRRRRVVPEPFGLEAALLLMAIPLLSPQGWDYVFLLAAPAVAFLVNYEDRLPQTWRIAGLVAVATVAFSLFDVMGRRAYATFMALSIITVCFLVVAGALYALRIKRAA